MPTRLDRELAHRGLARSRSHARQLIDAGSVRLNGHAGYRPSQPVADSDEVWVTDRDPYVSRAAHKLIGALDDLSVPVHGRAVDAGASTGGFSQVLLERGCDLVYAVDVGRDQLDRRVRSDPRVRAHDGVNVSYLSRDLVDGVPVDVVVADLSFISLRKPLPRLVDVLRSGGSLLAMVKPQFEAGRQAVRPDGVVRSPQLRRRAVDDVIDSAGELGWHSHGVVPSRVPGPAGNREYFVHFGTGAHVRDLGSYDLDTVDWS